MEDSQLWDISHWRSSTEMQEGSDNKDQVNWSRGAEDHPMNLLREAELKK